MAQVGKDCSIPWVLLGIQLLYETAGLKLRQVRKLSSHYVWLKTISRAKNCTKVLEFLNREEQTSASHGLNGHRDRCYSFPPFQCLV